jgi:hypothetical protein
MLINKLLNNKILTLCFMEKMLTILNYFSPNNERLPILTSRLMEKLTIQGHGHG